MSLYVKEARLSITLNDCSSSAESWPHEYGLYRLEMSLRIHEGSLGHTQDSEKNGPWGHYFLDFLYYFVGISNSIHGHLVAVKTTQYLKSRWDCSGFFIREARPEQIIRDFLVSIWGSPPRNPALSHPLFQRCVFNCCWTSTNALINKNTRSVICIARSWDSRLLRTPFERGTTIFTVCSEVELFGNDNSKITSSFCKTLASIQSFETSSALLKRLFLKRLCSFLRWGLVSYPF